MMSMMELYEQVDHTIKIDTTGIIAEKAVTPVNAIKSTMELAKKFMSDTKTSEGFGKQFPLT